MAKQIPIDATSQAKYSIPEMLHPPEIAQRQWNGNGKGLQRVPIGNPSKADVAPVAESFFQPLLKPQCVSLIG